MLGWFFKKKTPAEVQIQELENLLQLQNQLVSSLEMALVEANQRAAVNFHRGRETIAAVLMAAGGEIFVTDDITNVCHESALEIRVDQKDGGALLSLVPVEESEPQQAPLEEPPHESCGHCGV